MVLAVLVGCASRAPAPREPRPAALPVKAATAAAGPVPAPPALRLPNIARPTGYQVDLQLDPDQEDFTGQVRIGLTFQQPAAHLWLHGQEIDVAQATLVVGTQRLPVWSAPAGKDFVYLSFPRTIQPGAAALEISYRGKMRRHDGDGIYRVEENGAFYLFTQFEATDARQAFPCFDEPGYKVPWRLQIRTRAGLTALANTPAVAEVPEPGGWKTVTFAPTAPLPSYLVAFAVGPFEAVDAGKSKQGVPLRIVVPRGRSAEASYPAQVTGSILALLEDEFGTPYPFEKLDSLSVPVFNAGAMENPGLITYRQSIILRKPEELTLARRRSYASIAAHELAHQWFGNLVTMEFWDDIWLNEAFATWMASKVVARFEPEGPAMVSRVRSASAVMGQDSLASARMVRQPIQTANDINNAFDGITYNKGAAVLHMFERWIGEQPFRTGVRAYLDRHARGNATYADFVAAISAAAGREVRPAFDSFITQTGVPLVSFALTCDRAARGGGASLTMRQRRYSPLGSKLAGDRTWQIPICVRYGHGAGAAAANQGRACTLLSTASAQLALPALAGSHRCPDWVQPNQDAVGYYRSLLEGDLSGRLFARAREVLSLPERVGLIGDTTALVASGDLGPQSALALVEKLARDPSRHVVQASLGIVARAEEMVPPRLLPRYHAFIRAVYGAKARALGWHGQPDEEEETRELRPALVGFVAEQTGDPALVKQARSLTEKWLVDRRAIEPELVATVLAVASRHGDQALFDRFHAEARKTGDRAERARLLAAMAGFRDAALTRRILQIGLGDDFEPREALGLLQAPLRERGTRAAGYDFWKQNFDRIVERLPAGMRAGSVRVLTSLCDDKFRPEIEAVFGPKVRALEGGPRVMDQILEQLSSCSLGRRAQTPGVISFLSRRA
jgi:cytosol alanyl aminopeptidase